MRAILGLAILGALFFMAAAWQGRLTDDLKQRRERMQGSPSEHAEQKLGWSTLVVGRPSGAEPFPLPADLRPTSDSDDGTLELVLPRGSDHASGFIARESDWIEAPLLPDYEHEVRPGEILGRIYHEHYESGGVNEIQALAEYNGLASPDGIKQGQVLRLPDLRVLQQER